MYEAQTYAPELGVELVERLARGLGVWREDGSGAHMSAKRPLRVAAHGDGFVVWTWSERAVDRHVVDVGTALVLLLGHARGLRVDLGECQACRDRGSKRGLAMWEWDTLSASDALSHLGWGTNSVAGVACRACLSCRLGGGKPTGRRSIPWAQAVLDARTHECEGCPACDSKIDDGQRCDALVQPGDPETREALHVLADRLQADGDPLGTILAAWLRLCPDCEGRDVLPPAWNTECGRCHGHGTVLGGLEPQLAEALHQAIDDAGGMTAAAEA